MLKDCLVETAAAITQDNKKSFCIFNPQEQMEAL